MVFPSGFMFALDWFDTLWFLQTIKDILWLKIAKSLGISLYHPVEDRGGYFWKESWLEAVKM